MKQGLVFAIGTATGAVVLLVAQWIWTAVPYPGQFLVVLGIAALMVAGVAGLFFQLTDAAFSGIGRAMFLLTGLLLVLPAMMLVLKLLRFAFSA